MYGLAGVAERLEKALIPRMKNALRAPRIEECYYAAALRSRPVSAGYL